MKRKLKIDTIDANTILSIWVLLSDTTWLILDAMHYGFDLRYGVVGIMFLLGYIGLFYLFHKHHKALNKPTALRKRVSKHSSLILKHEQELKALKKELTEDNNDD